MSALVGVNLLCLAILTLAALGAGNLFVQLVRVEDAPIAIRLAAGLAVLSTLLGLLGIAGMLSQVPIALLLLAACIAALPSMVFRVPAVSRSGVIVTTIALLPVFLLTLYPPIAFDETLYHLPTVRTFAEARALPFIAQLRMPVFPHLDEVLRVPLLLFGGDIATHLLAFLATVVTAGVLFVWVREIRCEAAGWIAAALFVSAPIVVQLATTGYIEATLTMFIAASFLAFERWRRTEATGWLVTTAVLAASAAGVKYLGLFFLAVEGAAVLFGRKKEGRLRDVAVFVTAAIGMLALWYGRILYYTGNPLFPFAPFVFGHSAWDIPNFTGHPSLARRMTDVARLPWDTLFARSRVGYQPPFSPFLILTLPLILLYAFRDARARALGALVLAYAIIWSFLPHDARYLEPAIATAAVAGALAADELMFGSTSWRRFRALIAIVIVLPAPLYALHRIRNYGAPPAAPAAREAWLKREVPEYGAIAFLNEPASRSDVAYVCGGEQLAYYFRGRMIGDHFGPARYALATSAPDGHELARRLDGFGVRYVLVVKSRCAIPAIEGTPFYSRVYEDPLTVVYARSDNRI